MQKGGDSTSPPIFTFIYGLLDPCTNKIRYVGKADNPYTRLKEHLKESRYKTGTHKLHWIRTLRNVFPLVVILECTHANDWQECEKKWIKTLKEHGLDLTNTRDGGAGDSASDERKAAISHALTGRHLSEETRKKISIAHTGRRHSDETKRKMSASRSGLNNCWYGKHLPADARQKMSAAKKGKKLSTEHIKHIVESHSGSQNCWYGKKFSEEHKKKLSIAHLGQTPWNKGKTYRTGIHQ